MAQIEHFLTLLIILMRIVLTQGCRQKDVSCDDIRTPTGGYRYTCEGPAPTVIAVSHNKMSIAVARIKRQSFDFLEGKVESMNNNSVVTKQCLALRMKCTKDLPSGTVTESCLDFTITERPVEPVPLNATDPEGQSKNTSMPEPDPTDGTPKGGSEDLLIILSVVGVLLVIGILVTVLSRSVKRRHRSFYPVRRQNPPSAAENGHVGMNEVSPASDSDESGKNNEEQGDRIPSQVLAQSPDPQQNGGHHLDSNSCNGNGVLCRRAREAEESPNHRSMHRNSGHDPGGVNLKGVDMNGNSRITDGHDGRTSADGGVEDQEDEEQALLSQQATERDEPAGLVNNPCGDPSPTGGDHSDVESCELHSEPDT